MALQEQERDRTPQDDVPVDHNQTTPSKTEQVYGKQASGYPDLDAKQDLDPLTNREKTGTPGEKPDTNMQRMKDNDLLKHSFMAVIPPDQNDPEVKKLNEETQRLRDEANQNQSVMPKMGDNGEGSNSNQSGQSNQANQSNATPNGGAGNNSK